MRKSLSIIGLLLLSVSCSYFTPDAKPEAVARVEEAYLFRDDIKDLVPAGTSQQDSIAIVRNYIDRWAAQKLLINAAEINLSEDHKAEFDKLVQQYKIDLYSKGYIEQIVKRSTDTIVSDAELESYYKENKENFKTN